MTIIFKGLPEKQSTNSYDDIRRLSNNILSGKMNVVYDLTILPNTNETIIINQNVGSNSFINLIGLDENSLISNIYIKNRGSKTFTLGHDAVDVARAYSYIVIG